MIETVTKKYTDDNGDEHEVTGYDISEFPTPSDHDFYQEGRWMKCTCHPHRAVQVPAGKQLTKTERGFEFVEVEVL